jgi:Arc/MetJ family transcription regulator
MMGRPAGARGLKGKPDRRRSGFRLPARQGLSSPSRLAVSPPRSRFSAADFAPFLRRVGASHDRARICSGPNLTSVSTSLSLSCVRTTLDLPDDLLNEAQRLLRFKSKTDTVVLSLTELVRRRRIDELKELAGKIDLDLDVDTSRRRKPAKKSAAGKPRPPARKK